MKYIAYKPQSTSKPINIIGTIIIASFLAFLYGWLYSISTLIPIIYFKVLIAVGFGFTISYTVVFLSKFYHIKDKKSKLIIFSIVVLIAYYSIWVAFIIQTYDDGFPSFNNYYNYWINPKSFFSNIAEINKYGTWGINFSGIIKGFFLTGIWIIEAIIIIIIPILNILKLEDKPFSEKLNKWYPKYIINEEFEPIYSSSRFILKYKEKGVDIILELATGFAVKHSKITIYFLDGEDKQYLSIDNVYIKVKQENKTTITNIIKPFQISTIEAKKIFNHFNISKERIFDKL